MRHISYSNYRKEKEKEELKNNPPAAKKTPVGEPSTPVSETGVWGTIKDIGKGIAAGIPKAAEDTLETIKDVTEGLDTVTKAVTGGTIAPRTADLEMANLREPKEGPDAKIDLVPEVMKPETALGKTAMNLSSWAASYISGGKQLGAAFKGTKIMAGAAKASPLLAKVISGGVGGAVADLVTTDTADEGLADIMVNNKVMGSEMVRFLATKEDDSKAVIRLKRTAEGFLTGAALDTFMEAFSAVRRSGIFGKKAAQQAADVPLTKENVVKKAVKEASDSSQARDEAARRLSTTAEEAGVDLKDIKSSTVLTKEAAQQKERQAVQDTMRKRTGHAGNDTGLNADKFQTDTLRAFIDQSEKPLSEIFKNDHMDMGAERIQSIQRVFDAGFGDAFDEKQLEALRRGTADLELSHQVATWTVLVEDFLGTELTNTMQLMAEVTPEEMPKVLEKSRNLLIRGYEALEQTKKYTFKAGQALRAAGITHDDMSKALADAGVFDDVATESAETISKAQGKKMTKAQIDRMTLESAKDIVSEMDKDEILQLAQSIKITNANGGRITDLLMSSLRENNKLLQTQENSMWRKMTKSLIKYRYFAMLCGVKTQAKNLIGDSLKFGLMMVEEPIKCITTGIAGGFKDKGFSGIGVGAMNGAKESIDFYKGLYYGWDITAEHIANAWKYAEAISHVSEVGNLLGNERDSALEAIAGTVFEAPFKALAAIDDGFATSLAAANSYQRAMKDLRASGVLAKIKDAGKRKDFVDAFIESSFMRDFQETILDDGKKMRLGKIATEQGKEIAAEGTFQQKLGQTMESFIKWTNSNPALKIVFPFVRTPANLLKDVFITRGAGMPFEFVAAMRTGDPQQIGKAMTHLASGAALWYTAYNMAAEGKITGNGPTNKVARDALYANGWQPHSFKMGDKYIQLATIEPWGSAFEVMADWFEKIDRGEITDGQLEPLLDCLFAFAANRTYFQGLTSLLSDMKYNRMMDVGGFVAATVTSFAPAFATEMSRAIDPVIYQQRDILSTINKSIGNTALLEPKRSWITGDPLVYSSNGGLGAFSPISKTEDHGNRVFGELSKVTNVGDPSRIIGSHRLDDTEYSRYCQLIGTTTINGKTLYESLDELVTSDWYDIDRTYAEDPSVNGLSKERNKAIRQVTDAYKEQAEREITEELGLEQSDYTPQMPQPFAAITDF